MCTLKTLGGACSNEVVQVNEENWNLVGSDEDPLHHVCDVVKNKWSRLKAKGESQVHVEMVVPLHPQKNTVGGMYGHVAVGCLHIKFAHEGPRTKFGNYADHLIDCDVMKGAERSMIRCHFPGCPLLGVTPKQLT